jgi:hypothetical protein
MSVDSRLDEFDCPRPRQRSPGRLAPVRCRRAQFRASSERVQESFPSEPALSRGHARRPARAQPGSTNASVFATSGFGLHLGPLRCGEMRSGALKPVPIQYQVHSPLPIRTTAESQSGSRPIVGWSISRGSPFAQLTSFTRATMPATLTSSPRSKSCSTTRRPVAKMFSPDHSS